VKIVPAIYAALIILGVAAAVLVPLTMYRSGSTAFPIWRASVSPGPLSASHAFLSAQCEACHTPNRGIEAASCLTCHHSDAPLLAKQSTAFHADVQDCRGCHIEHRGAAVRPTAIDHNFLARLGWQKQFAASSQTETAAMPEVDHLLAVISGRHPASPATCSIASPVTATAIPIAMPRPLAAAGRKPLPPSDPCSDTNAPRVILQRRGK
jgi:CxxC motif-containing protein (DUF1111 family)